MDQVLEQRAQAAGAREQAGRWWPVDTLFLAWLAATGALIFFLRSQVPGAWRLLALHAAGALLLILAVKWDRGRTSGAAWVFRHWYPLPYVVACYREVGILIPAIRGLDLDAQMARLDLVLWGVHPTVWLERIQTPWLTELVQVVYVLFPAVVLPVAWALWRRRRFAEFRYYAFLIALGFLLSFVGYLLVPVRGPRFFLASLQHTQLEGLWLYEALRRGLDVVEATRFDCFPSGHVEVTLLILWSSRRVSRNLFGWYSVYTVLMVFSTVYLRYHYTVDLLAGALLGLALLRLGPWLHGQPEARP